MENPNLEQRLQRIESLLKSQKNTIALNKKRRERTKKIDKVSIILIEKMIQMLFPYIAPFIIHFWDILYNLL